MALLPMVSQLSEIAYEKITLKHPDLCKPTLLPKVPLGTAEASWTTEVGMPVKPVHVSSELQ